MKEEVLYIILILVLVYVLLPNSMACTFLNSHTSSCVACMAVPYLFYIISLTTRFSEKRFGHKMCLDFLYYFRLKHLSFYEYFSEI
jgi:hypothetical protein